MPKRKTRGLEFSAISKQEGCGKGVALLGGDGGEIQGSGPKEFMPRNKEKPTVGWFRVWPCAGGHHLVTLLVKCGP